MFGYLIVGFICLVNDCYGLAVVAVVVGLLYSDSKKGTSA